MGAKEEESGRVVVLGQYRITANNMRYKVKTMGEPDEDNHFYNAEKGNERLVVKEEVYYSSFEGLCQGILEKYMKRKFQVSGLQGLYTNALKDLMQLISAESIRKQVGTDEC
jgi:hypothetical protein